MASVSVSAGEAPERLTFGSIEPLVTLMEETSPAKLVGLIVDQLKQGTELKQLVAAAALANARTFGGEDYVGFHTMMAFAPAFHMARELPKERQPLPVIKVLYRNTNRIQESGGRGHEVLHPVAAEQLSPGQPGGEALRDAVRAKNLDSAEKTFAALAGRGADEAFNDLLFAVQDNTEVHRTVLPYRAWDLLSIIGPEQAHTLSAPVGPLLRQERAGLEPHTRGRPAAHPLAQAARRASSRRQAAGLAPGGGWLGRSHEPDDLRRHSRSSRRGRRRRPGRRDGP